MAQAHHNDSPTLRDYVRVVLVRKRIVIAVVVLFTVAAAAYSLLQPKVYEASARLMYSPPADISNPTSSASSTDVNTLTLQLQSIGNTLHSPGVVSDARQELGSSLADSSYTVTAKVVAPESSVSSGNAIADSVDVSAQAGSPEAAAKIANSYAAAVIALRKKRQQETLASAQSVVRDQLDLLKASGNQDSQEYATLSLQLRNLQIAEAAANGDFVVLQPATPSAAPASPKPVKTAMLGFVAGVFAGVVLAFLLAQFDTRVRDYRELASRLGLEVIGRVPRIPRQVSGDQGLVALSEPDGVVSESVRVLRRNLEWSRIDGALTSLIMTSCLKGEGKTLTLCNLAVTLARAGSKVVVVDADLRNPQVHRVFNLPSIVGLTSVAMGSATLDQALIEFKAAHSSTVVKTASQSVPAEVAPWEGSLRILASGPVPPNPGEVAASHRVQQIIHGLAASDADFVLVDAPPLLAFGDAGAIAAATDGVIMVANVAKARRAVLEEGREVLETLPCRKVGLVVIGEPRDATKYSTYASYASARSLG